MLLDVVGAIGLTASAAIVIGALVAMPPLTAGQRTGLVMGLSAWFAAVAVVGGMQLLAPERTGAAGVGALVLVPILALAYAGARPGLLGRLRLALPIEFLVGVNAVRLLGVLFILLYAVERLPAPFAPVAGWGDVAIGLAALPVALIARRRPPGWRPTVLAWNTLGLLDLVTAIGLGVASSPGAPFRIFFGEPGTALMSSLPWLLIPGFLVPLLAMTHLAIFSRLLVTRPSSLTARASLGGGR
jgi:hypothetical protein